ncbi:hypothetical protein GA0115255_123242 [Streptomyces sp. Ncost-T6T-2b]|nr:hypothetical protein GA0115255_123242 [Streptomyces sp. Ncost-T6T-2b]
MTRTREINREIRKPETGKRDPKNSCVFARHRIPGAESNVMKNHTERRTHNTATQHTATHAQR